MMTNKDLIMSDQIKLDGVKLDDIANLDHFFSATQYIGRPDKSISDNLFGINHRQIEGIIPENRDAHGLVFFTRPQLNLTVGNLRNDRKFYKLLTRTSESIHRYVRVMLDPRLPFDPYLPVDSFLVDNQMPFIPILTNTIKTISGWPDVVLPTYTSKNGLMKEQWSVADGTVEIFESFDLDATFRNTKDEPTSMLMQTWLKYMDNVFQGKMVPYLDYITENTIDYNTRIYVFIMDETKRVVKKVAAVGAAFPLNAPFGRMFDYNKEIKYNDQNKDINIRFRCLGAMYNDDILLHEFNKTVGIFNPDIRNMIRTGQLGNLVKIPQYLIHLANNRGYPYINTATNELEWYIRRDSYTYKNLMAAVKR